MNELQRQIVVTFEQLVLEHGYTGATLDDVARTLRISKKTIYVHFNSKRDIYAEVVAGQAQHEKALLASSVASLPSFTARIEAATRAVLSLGRKHILETTETEWLHEYEIAADAFRKATGDVLRELVQGGMDAGELRAGDASLVEAMVAAMIVEYLLIVRANPSFDHDKELVERICRFVS